MEASTPEHKSDDEVMNALRDAIVACAIAARDSAARGSNPGGAQHYAQAAESLTQAFASVR